MDRKTNKILKLIISILICQTAGIIGSLFTAPAILSWYTTLQKPSFNPPNWVFAPIWTLLFLLMGIALYFIWDSQVEYKEKRIPIFVFSVQLVLNIFWSILFFGLQLPFYAFIEIFFLWLAILVTIISFSKIFKPAAYLLIPYILWVSFAGYLNYSIWALNQIESTACVMDAKLCLDGSYVYRVPPECNFALCPKEDLIQVEDLRANDAITSPLVIKGKARGFWFFEASFPIKLYNGNGELLATSVAQTQDNWMTEDFVSFSAELKFENPKTEKGTLVLEKDNPSGLLEHADELRVPVLFVNETKTIKLFYYNAELDKDELGNVVCSRNGLMAVEREIAVTKTPIQDTIKLLLLGQITEQERSQGINTEYPLDGFSLKTASLEDDVLTLGFDDPKNRTVGGSCRVGILWFQVEATAKQFSEVNQVRFLPEDIFQP